MCVKRRWPNIILLLLYFGLGVGAEIAFLYHNENNPYILMTGVFAIIGVVAIAMLELTRHEKSIYIIPMAYDERKRYYYIGILINFTITLLVCLLFIAISIIIDKQYGMSVIKRFAMCGLPYIEVAALQKINMFKGKKKKDKERVME